MTPPFTIPGLILVRTPTSEGGTTMSFRLYHMCLRQIIKVYAFIFDNPFPISGVGKNDEQKKYHNHHILSIKVPKLPTVHAVRTFIVALRRTSMRAYKKVKD